MVRERVGKDTCWMERERGESEELEVVEGEKSEGKSGREGDREREKASFRRVRT